MIGLIVRVALAASLTTVVCHAATQLEHGVAVIQAHQQREAESMRCAADPQCTSRLAAVARVAAMTLLALGFGLVLPATAPMPQREQRLRHVLTAAVAVMLITGRLLHHASSPKAPASCSVSVSRASRGQEHFARTFAAYAPYAALWSATPRCALRLYAPLDREPPRCAILPPCGAPTHGAASHERINK